MWILHSKVKLVQSNVSIDAARLTDNCSCVSVMKQKNWIAYEIERLQVKIPGVVFY